MHFFLYMVAGLFAAQFVLGPIIVRFVQKLSTAPDFQPVSVESLPPEIYEFFGRKSAELSPEGFSVKAYLMLKDFVPGQLMHIMMVENELNKDTAMAVVAETSAGKITKIGAKYLEFYTEFSDGSQLTVNNSSHLNVFKTVPERIIIQLPEIQDGVTLYKIYQRSINRFGKWGKVSLIGRDTVDILQSSIEKEMALQIKNGYFYIDRPAQIYKPTWKGAILMTWKLIWPIKSILMARRKGRNKQLLEGLEIS